MKKTLLFLVLALYVSSTFGQEGKCCETYVFEGYILTDKGEKLGIKLNFLILLNNAMVGQYHYNPTSGALKLVGEFSNDNSFEFVERDKNEKITGYFKGTLTSDKNSAAGKWTSPDGGKEFDFKLERVIGKSYWDYIKKNRNYFEYKDLSEAIKRSKNVLSIDVANQGLSNLPDGLGKLRKIESISLLGNRFSAFPRVLSKLVTWTKFR